MCNGRQCWSLDFGLCCGSVWPSLRRDILALGSIVIIARCVCVCVCLFERRKAFLRDSVHHDLVVHRSADVALGAEVLGAVVCAEQTTGDQPEADVGFFGFAVQLKS